jgi:GNAT superfamily N-acetyltransferase
MLKVLPEYQGRGIGSGLLKAAMREAPGPVDPGWMTDQGYLYPVT